MTTLHGTARRESHGAGEPDSSRGIRMIPDYSPQARTQRAQLSLGSYPEVLFWEIAIDVRGTSVPLDSRARKTSRARSLVRPSARGTPGVASKPFSRWLPILLLRSGSRY